MMRTVLITGAGGNLRRKLCAYCEELGWSLRLLDVERRDEPNIIAADLSVWDDSWSSAFAGVDAVVHLAATPTRKLPGPPSSA